jgi:hypothetical protein
MQGETHFFPPVQPTGSFASAMRREASPFSRPPNCMLTPSEPVEGRIGREASDTAFDAVHSKCTFPRVRQDSITAISSASRPCAPRIW